jgi:hypothetical protein
MTFNLKIKNSHWKGRQFRNLCKFLRIMVKIFAQHCCTRWSIATTFLTHFFILLSLTLVAWCILTLCEWIISIKSITLWKLQMFTIKVLPLILHIGWLCTVGVQMGTKEAESKIKFTWAERMKRRMDGVYKIRDAYLCVYTWNIHRF